LTNIIILETLDRLAEAHRGKPRQKFISFVISSKGSCRQI
jgi:hypothetical protein